MIMNSGGIPQNYPFIVWEFHGMCMINHYKPLLVTWYRGNDNQ